MFNRVVPDGTTDFREVAKAIAPLRPNLVLFGGEYDAGAQLTKQVTEAGITVPVMGGGLKDDAYIVKAGPASDADLASTVDAPLSALTSAKPFTDAYARGAFAEPASDFGVYAYDAANIIVGAAAKGSRGRAR